MHIADSAPPSRRTILGHVRDVRVLMTKDEVDAHIVSEMVKMDLAQGITSTYYWQGNQLWGIRTVHHPITRQVIGQEQAPLIPVWRHIHVEIVDNLPDDCCDVFAIPRGDEL